ncbi:unnamed protein product [Brassica napus]|nr:unnamed protein product [Brassica napus]
MAKRVTFHSSPVSSFNKTLFTVEKMASKSFVLLGLFALIFVVSEVATASALQSGTVNLGSEETVEPDQYGGGHGGHGGYNIEGGSGGLCAHGCCSKRSGTVCYRCCSYAGETVQTQPDH